LRRQQAEQWALGAAQESRQPHEHGGETLLLPPQMRDEGHTEKTRSSAAEKTK
jgi:hypothetical protein